MKAYTIKEYGAPQEVLKLEDIEKPVPKNTEVLVEVKASSINDFDWCLSTGNPYAYRLFFGLFKPKKKMRIPGMEVAGVITQVGDKANKFDVGDSVYGDISDHGFGSFAEYLCIDEKALALKPEAMSFEEATCIPHAAMLALQGLRDLGEIQDGQKVLINGGGGGVGFFGLQIAKLYNVDVTGVDTGDKLKDMLDRGFDQVIDYKKEDFIKNGEQYDLILDCRTKRSLSQFLKSLTPTGKYVSIGGDSGKLMQLLYMNPLLKIFSKKSMHMLVLKANSDLDYISELYTNKKISCVVDGPYPFDKLPWAVQRFGDATHTGKVVISMA